MTTTQKEAEGKAAEYQALCHVKRWQIDICQQKPFKPLIVTSPLF